MLKIGNIEDNGGEYIIHREFYRQGMIFKDEEAYKFHKDQPCYSPELSDSVYTGNDFLELCNCQQDLADELFEGQPSLWLLIQKLLSWNLTVSGPLRPLITLLELLSF